MMKSATLFLLVFIVVILSTIELGKVELPVLVALHTNNNTTIKSVAPHCYAYQQQDDDNYNEQKK
jgi:hypothetical protein